MPQQNSHFLVLKDDLVAFAWSAPMRDLAAKIGISDVGLKKLLRADGVVTPPQGHWNRVLAGKKVLERPRPGARRPGEIGRVRLDGRFRGLVPEAGPMPETGPFASAAVPEDLQELRAKEVKAIGRVAVAKTLDQPHPALAPLLKREEQRREKQAATGWVWDGPQWASALAQRQLRIVDAVFRALSRRDHSVWIRVNNQRLEIHCTIGSMSLELAFYAAGRSKKRQTEALAGNAPADTDLCLALVRERDIGTVMAWDDGDGGLERRIGSIAADLIVAGEAAFRHHLVEQREWSEQIARWQAERDQAEIRRLEEKRLADLRKSGELLRGAAEIRALIENVRGAVVAGSLAIQAGQLQRWEGWALRQANLLDPVLSGQVLSHLIVPELDGHEGIELASPVSRLPLGNKMSE